MTTASLTSRDIQVRDAVMRQLDWDPRVDASAVAVSAKDGAVTLTGFIDSYAGKLAAERAAKRVRGVRAVANDVEVRLKLERTDADIAADVVLALKLRGTVPDAVQAAVHNGHVSLTGHVHWLFQKWDAEEAIRHVNGVRAVANHITVAPGTAAADVRHRIVKELHHNADLDARHIKVAVAGDTATLTGTVATWFQRESAERAAADAPGICEVINLIEVNPVTEGSRPGPEPLEFCALQVGPLSVIVSISSKTNPSTTLSACLLSAPRRQTRRRRRVDRAVVPMLVGLAVLDPPHVEPRRRVHLSRLQRIRQLAHDPDHDQIAFRDDRDDFRPPRVACGNRPLGAAAEELHHRIEPGLDVRVVLDVLAREVFRGVAPVPRLEQIPHDVQHDLLVDVELWIGAREQRFRIGGRGDRRLSPESSRRGGDNGQCETNEECSYVHARHSIAPAATVSRGRTPA